MSHRLDDPHAIDAFFAAFKKPIETSKEPRKSQEKFDGGVSLQDNGSTAYAQEHAVSVTDKELAVGDTMKQIVTPAHGATIPSVVPATPAAVSVKNIVNPPSANKNQALTQGDKKLDSKGASSKSAWIGKDDRANYLYSPNKLDYTEMPQRMTSVQVELLEKLGKSSAGHSNYQKDVIARFKAAAEVAGRLEVSQKSPAAEKDHDIPEEISEETQVEVKEKEDVSSHQDQPIDESSLSFQENTMSSDTFQTYPDKVVASSPELTISPATSPLSAPVEIAGSSCSIPEDVPVIKREPDDTTSVGPQTADSNDMAQDTDDASSRVADMNIDQEADNNTHDNAQGVDQTDVEDRKHAAVFKSWGTPMKRDKAASQVRKIVLSQLPPKADFTLVQSLIHGGAIEDMVLSSSGTTAQVRLTTADACDRYFDKYPNGLQFKLKGKAHLVFVDKGRDVDVISGMLEGYLGAGATRVVQASDADEDWSMRALSKIAEGKNGRRKVESIVDSFRDEVRTITFRFTNIADAVAFRGSLLRDPEWEYSNLQFVTDPCEKATGIHFD